jgi:hypothetical protein
MIWRMRIACWVPKATFTHSLSVIFIVFPLQQWLQECASILRYKCIACLVRIRFIYRVITVHIIIVY